MPPRKPKKGRLLSIRTPLKRGILFERMRVSKKNPLGTLESTLKRTLRKGVGVDIETKFDENKNPVSITTRIKSEKSFSRPFRKEHRLTQAEMVKSVQSIKPKGTFNIVKGAKGFSETLHYASGLLKSKKVWREDGTLKSTEENVFKANSKTKIVREFDSQGRIKNETTTGETKWKIKQ